MTTILRPIIASMLLLLSACDSQGLGGGAGDSVANPDAVLLVSPFEGIYDLPDNWRGDAPNEAFLQILAPNEQGEAQAILLDINDNEQCIPTRLSTGVVLKDPSSNRVFMNGLVVFLDAILTLSGSTLVIQLPQDSLDVDMDNITDEMIEFNAPGFAGDLPPVCS